MWDEASEPPVNPLPSSRVKRLRQGRARSDGRYPKWRAASPGSRTPHPPHGHAVRRPWSHGHFGGMGPAGLCRMTAHRRQPGRPACPPGGSLECVGSWSSFRLVPFFSAGARSRVVPAATSRRSLPIRSIRRPRSRTVGHRRRNRRTPSPSNEPRARSVDRARARARRRGGAVGRDDETRFAAASGDRATRRRRPLRLVGTREPRRRRRCTPVHRCVAVGR